MWLWVSMILLAFSVSMDSLSVGITYGMGGVRFSCFSLALIACMSGMMVFVSMNIGRLLALVLPLQVERGLASVILMALGGWAIYNVYKPKGDGSDSSMECDGTGEANRFSGAVQVLKRPELGDLDRSGTISQKEALLIGIALSMDSFGAGVRMHMTKTPFTFCRRRPWSKCFPLWPPWDSGRKRHPEALRRMARNLRSSRRANFKGSSKKSSFLPLSREKGCVCIWRSTSATALAGNAK